MIAERRKILQLQGVSKVYDTGAAPFVALKNVTLDVSQGEFLGITGKSGAGKTTLLNMISGVSEVTEGTILFSPAASRSRPASIALESLGEDQLAQWRGENLGIVYQSFELMPTLSLVENVMLPPDFSGSYHPVVSKKRALELLELVEIMDHARKIPAHISGGQKQRVAIARALVNDPPLIIADEPTGNLDSLTAEMIFQIFERLVEQGKTIIMVTHDESFASRFSRRLQIADGVVTSPGEIETDAPARSGRVTEGADRDATREKPGDRTVIPLKGSRADTVSTTASEPKPAIILRNVNKVYDNAAGRFVALKSVDLRLNYGRFISVVGKSGCGKSTLLNMITGIDHPTAGDVIVGNEHIYQMGESRRALWRGRNMGVVFQFFQLLPTLTLLENIMLPMDYCNLHPFSERPERAMELLRLVGLEDEANKLPAEVSSGEQQSAAIARALATDPPIILADEPTGNLDSQAAKNILDLFKRLAERGKTVLIVTHDPSIAQQTDQTIILSDGEIIDPTVASALPFLSHPQMLDATHSVEKRSYAAGTPVLRQGEAVEHFYMIESGDVEVLAIDGQSKTTPLARLEQGQFFGEVELTNGSRSMSHVQAGSSGARLVALPKEVFHRLIGNSPRTRHAIHEAAAAKLAENGRRRAAA